MEIEFSLDFLSLFLEKNATIVSLPFSLKTKKISNIYLTSWLVFCVSVWLNELPFQVQPSSESTNTRMQPPLYADILS